MANEKILIVEDEAIVAESLRDKLEELGYAVAATVPSGEEALVKANALRPDLVLMDVRLKGKMDGVETAGILKETLGLPVIFLTAYSDSNTLQRAKITEPFGYIVKPFKEKELHTTIEISLYKYRTDKLIKDNERWLSTVLKSIGDGVITIDSEATVTSMSPIAETLTGWTFQDCYGRPITSLLKLQGDIENRLIQNLISQGLDGKSIKCLVDEDAVLISQKNEKIPIDIGIAPLKDQTAIQGVVFTIRDITERKKTEQMLIEAQEMLSNSLTLREKEILQRMVNGSTTKEIAYDLDISPRTVEAHRRNMMQKLDVQDMSMLVRLAITHRLVSIKIDPMVS